MQRLLPLLLLFCALAWAPVQAQKKTEILWDTYGVPHVYARNTEAMYYAFGWAQMHNHANLLLKLYGQARGRGAEYWGEAFRESDQQVHLFNLPELAKKNSAKQTRTPAETTKPLFGASTPTLRPTPKPLRPTRNWFCQ